MGNFIKKLFFKKEDFASVLGQITKEISETEIRLKSHHAQWRKRARQLLYFLLASELIYGLWYYLYCTGVMVPVERILCTSIFIFIFSAWYLTVKSLGFYYEWRISSDSHMIDELTQKQKTKLEEFMENGSYKEVTKVLDDLAKIVTPHKGSAPHPLLAYVNSSLNARNRVGRMGLETPKSAVKSSTQKQALEDKSGVSTKRTHLEHGDSLGSVSKKYPSSNQESVPGNNRQNNDENLLNAELKLNQLQSATRANNPSSIPSSNQKLIQTPQRLLLQPVPQSPYQHSFQPSALQQQQQQQQQQGAKGHEDGGNKGWMDSLLDMFVGNSVMESKKCEKCGAFNGMIPKEELPNASFICHLCKFYNQSTYQINASRQATSQSKQAPQATRDLRQEFDTAAPASTSQPLPSSSSQVSNDPLAISNSSSSHEQSSQAEDPKEPAPQSEKTKTSSPSLSSSSHVVIEPPSSPESPNHPIEGGSVMAASAK